MNAGNTRIWTGNARVHLFAHRVHLQAETACLRRCFGRRGRLDTAITANLKEIGYGG